MAFVRSEVSSLGSSQLTQILDAMSFSGGSIEADIDHSGHLVSDRGTVDIGMDLGALDPSAAGTTMSIHETIAATFRDYGASIVVPEHA